MKGKIWSIAVINSLRYRDKHEEKLEQILGLRCVKDIYLGEGITPAGYKVIKGVIEFETEKYHDEVLRETGAMDVNTITKDESLKFKQEIGRKYPTTYELRTG